MKVWGKMTAAVLAFVFALCAAVPAAVQAEEITQTVEETVTEETTQTAPPEDTTVPVPPEEKPQKKETVVKHFPERLDASYEQALSVTIKVAPANPRRVVKLQRYSTAKGKYLTVKRYTTKKGRSAKVKLVFPKKYRRRTTGKWRVVVSKSENATRYVSKAIILTSRNLKNLNLNAKRACIYCQNNDTTLYGKWMYDRRKMASTTKVMTALLLCESGKIDGTTRISSHAVNTDSANLYMKTGDVYRNRDLLYALLLPSSNDAATAISEGVAGSEGRFVSMMNAKAKELGLNDTSYKNPHGLNANNHYTSAYDLARLMGAAYQYADFRKVIATSEYSFSSVRFGYKKTVRTTDKIKWYSKRHKGGKTGFTTPSGYCYTAVFVSGGRTYTIALLGNSSVSTRWEDVKKLYRYIDGFAHSKY